VAAVPRGAMISPVPPPRLFCIPAARAPLVAVFRRGPSRWSHVGKWDVDRGIYEPGSWIAANLYPQRCDVSPDGRWLCYFTLKASARWTVGPTYMAISRLPWLTALAAWSTCGTWTRGAHFVEDRTVWQVGEPSHGDVTPCRRKFGLAVTRPMTFAVEHRRGWSETADTPPRGPNDLFDEQRAEAVKMEKPRPRAGGEMRLVVQGWFAAFREGPFGRRVGGRDRDRHYSIVENGRVRTLDDVQWADWSADGRLLVATLDGKLQVRDEPDASSARWEADLSVLTPGRTPPPDEAHAW
jgi:hypothetical protein